MFHCSQPWGYTPPANRPLNEEMRERQRQRETERQRDRERERTFDREFSEQTNKTEERVCERETCEHMKWLNACVCVCVCVFMYEYHPYSRALGQSLCTDKSLKIQSEEKQRNQREEEK